MQLLKLDSIFFSNRISEGKVQSTTLVLRQGPCQHRINVLLVTLVPIQILKILLFWVKKKYHTSSKPWCIFIAHVKWFITKNWEYLLACNSSSSTQVWLLFAFFFVARIRNACLMLLLHMLLLRMLPHIRLKCNIMIKSRTQRRLSWVPVLLMYRFRHSPANNVKFSQKAEKMQYPGKLWVEKFGPKYLHWFSRWIRPFQKEENKSQYKK